MQYYKAGLAISDIMAATGLPYQDAYTKLLRGGAQLRPPSQARLARPGTPSATWPQTLIMRRPPPALLQQLLLSLLSPAARAPHWLHWLLLAALLWPVVELVLTRLA